jgi:hypothetical protein
MRIAVVAIGLVNKKREQKLVLRHRQFSGEIYPKRTPRWVSQSWHIHHQNLARLSFTFRFGSGPDSGASQLLTLLPNTGNFTPPQT